MNEDAVGVVNEHGDVKAFNAAPKPTDLVDTGEVETVTVCGAELPLQEWNNATRAMWLAHAETHDLRNVTRSFMNLQQQLNTVLEAPTKVKVQRELVKKLEVALANRIAAVKPEKYTAETRAQLNDMAETIDAEKKLLRELEDPANLGKFEETKPLDAALEELRGAQREIQLRFVHKLSGATSSFETFAADATGSDYQAAEEVITAGNEPWLSQSGQPMNRAQRRKSKKS